MAAIHTPRREELADLAQHQRQDAEEVQQRIDHNLPSCQFKKALEEAMALADLSPTEQALVDLRKGVDEWGPLDVVVSRLVKVYSAYRDSRWSST